MDGMMYVCVPCLSTDLSVCREIWMNDEDKCLCPQKSRWKWRALTAVHMFSTLLSALFGTHSRPINTFYSMAMSVLAL